MKTCDVCKQADTDEEGVTKCMRGRESYPDMCPEDRDILIRAKVLSRAQATRKCHICAEKIKKDSTHIRIQGGSSWKNKTFFNICPSCLDRMNRILWEEDPYYKEIREAIV